MDRCFEYEEVTKPLSWLSKAKSFEHAIDVLAQYEAKVAKFENKYSEKLDERAKMVAVKELMARLSSREIASHSQTCGH